MALTYIRDRNGSIIGKIDVLSNGDKIIMDKNGKILGRYKKSQNLTIDDRGYIVARCEALMMLLK